VSPAPPDGYVTKGQQQYTSESITWSRREERAVYIPGDLHGERNEQFIYLEISMERGTSSLYTWRSPGREELAVYIPGDLQGERN